MRISIRHISIAFTICLSCFQPTIANDVQSFGQFLPERKTHKINPERKLTTPASYTFDGHTLKSWEVAGAEHFMKALDLINKDNYPQALKELRLSLEIIPWYEKAQLNYANVLIKLGHDDQADLVLKELLSEHPNYAKGWFVQGIHKYKCRDWKTSYDAFMKALELNLDRSDATIAHSLLGRIHRIQNTMGKTSKTITESDYRDYNKAISLAEEGLSYIDKANHADLAVEKFNKALCLAPKNLEIRHLLAIALLKSGHLSQSITEAQKCIQMDPNYAWGWNIMGSCHLEQGDFNAAIRCYKRFLTLAKSNDSNNKEELKYTENLVSVLERELSNCGTSTLLNADNYLLQINKGGLYRWKTTNMPLKVFIESGQTIEGYSPNYENYLRSAFSTWQKASVGKISFSYTNDQKAADITCRWSADYARVKRTGEAGTTKTHLAPNGFINKVDITIFTKLSAKTESIPAESMRRVTLHEVGHALGLSGHSKNSKDIMFFSNTVCDSGEIALSKRDINTLLSLYALDDSQISIFKLLKELKPDGLTNH